LIFTGTIEEMLETSLQALLDSTCEVHENMALMLLCDQGDKIPVFLGPVKPVNFDHQVERKSLHFLKVSSIPVLPRRKIVLEQPHCTVYMAVDHC